MVDVRITLSGLWAAMMLTYLLGDVIRVFGGDFKAGEMGGQQASQWMWLLAAGAMFIPIAMVVMSLTVPYPAIRWVSIVLAMFLVVFNLVALSGALRQRPHRRELRVQRADRLVRLDVDRRLAEDLPG